VQELIPKGLPCASAPALSSEPISAADQPRTDYAPALESTTVDHRSRNIAMTMKTRFADAFCGPPGRKSRRPKRLLAHGIEDVKKFFIALDEPFITQHFVDVVYRYGNAYFMQGSASLRKKGDPPEKSFQAAPLFNSDFRRSLTVTGI
jgi:hypothetical protein